MYSRGAPGNPVAHRRETEHSAVDVNRQEMVIVEEDEDVVALTPGSGEDGPGGNLRAKLAGRHDASGQSRLIIDCHTHLPHDSSTFQWSVSTAEVICQGYAVTLRDHQGNYPRCGCLGRRG